MLSKMLHVCFFNRNTRTSKIVNAKLFKFGEEYKDYQNDILYFCNWAGEPIDLKEGRDLYRSLQ